MSAKYQVVDCKTGVPGLTELRLHTDLYQNIYLLLTYYLIISFSDEKRTILTHKCDKIDGKMLTAY